uniref:Uncharacterized protein n=1 Tax=Parascaris equorum TaxID=6256 RepID=A0A914S2B4_PAREQ
MYCFRLLMFRNGSLLQRGSFIAPRRYAAIAVEEKLLIEE